eukprot:Protomagalhaensia_sp_Gyna_25__5108@NODE_58_length_5893_cov_92_436112_g43_i0_p2_GENE_NODE_58_length_5893_cov_92_436112_g43_i0NODE_58_length_5893_cov_92_436112_g43_i0_p2_ORF_typecomplete_len551_score113_56SET/PF00856_28/2_4e03SET/PF00856_28/2_9e11SET/PF00856_28/3_8e03TPR_12/PF13424_6/0_17TPR_12/PF13424_6/81AAA_13/PF13166_6/0_14Elf1/PF05129_13/0_4NOB1_Zn_bind/PF08772_11/0_72_NODE_58_length_5893_cov_92_436112_g43_i010782730
MVGGQLPAAIGVVNKKLCRRKKHAHYRWHARTTAAPPTMAPPVGLDVEDGYPTAHTHLTTKPYEQEEEVAEEEEEDEVAMGYSEYEDKRTDDPEEEEEDLVGGSDELEGYLNESATAGEADPHPHLRPYSHMMIDQRVFIKRVEGKGRCLFARRAFKPGDIIFVESPVLAAIPSVNPELWTILKELNDEEPLNLPPIWHLGAVTSLTKLDLTGQRAVQEKFVPDPDAPPGRDVKRVLGRTGLALDPYKFERALNAWRFNGFGHHAENEGLILYDRISNMAHSCNSSATWHYAANDAFVLRARQHLAAGDEITISYIGDEDLLKPTHTRRERLASWQFTCRCHRCSDPVDLCRGFRCPDCGTGTIFLKTDAVTNADGEEEYVTGTQPCSVCQLTFSTEQIQQYEQFEEAYIARLEETSKEYLSDLELVYQEAGRVFTQHHVMYELDTMLYEAYKDEGRWWEAIYHLEKRIQYASAVRRGVRTKDAWMHEDLGDLLTSAGNIMNLSGFYKNAIARAYETAFNGLIILCGADHDYTLAAHAKFEQIIKSSTET